MSDTLLHGQVEVVAKISTDTSFSHIDRQLPAFIVTAFCFDTAKSIVKSMFKGQYLQGTMTDNNGNVEELRTW